MVFRLPVFPVAIQGNGIYQKAFCLLGVREYTDMEKQHQRCQAFFHTDYKNTPFKKNMQLRF